MDRWVEGDGYRVDINSIGAYYSTYELVGWLVLARFIRVPVCNKCSYLLGPLRSSKALDRLVC